MRYLLVLCCVCACSQRDPGPGIDVDRALGFVRMLATPRPYDTDAARIALHAIEDQLQQLGIAFEEVPTGTVELPAIDVLGAVYRQQQRLTVGDPNVVVRFGPPGKALLVMAHYDSVPGSPGACDNAAAVAILVELARVLHAAPPRQPVIFAFTAAEESGLAGAEALAAKLGDDVGFAIALDLLGGDGPLVLNGASELIGRAELAWLHDASDAAGVELTAPIAHRIVSRWWPQAERSDHGPFTRRGVRAVHFYNRGNDGEWIDRAYHSPRDQWPRVHRESVAAVGRLVRALVDSPVPAHTGDGFWVPLAHIVIPRWLLIALELGLAIVTLLALARRRGPRVPGAGLLAGAACYAIAIGIAIGIERVTLPYAGAWLLAPLRMTIASVLVFGGSFGLVTRAAARFWPWAGADRYRAVAALACVGVGLLTVALGAAELAWVWLVPAAVIAIAPPPLAIPTACLPALLVLHPLQLREAGWNGFLPLSLPLAVWVALLAVPAIAAISWALRRRLVAGPLGTLALGVGCGLAVIAGAVIAITAPDPCTPAEFVAFHLGCQRV